MASRYCITKKRLHQHHQRHHTISRAKLRNLGLWLKKNGLLYVGCLCIVNTNTKSTNQYEFECALSDAGPGGSVYDSNDSQMAAHQCESFDVCEDSPTG